MPRLMDNDAMEVGQIGGMQGFKFSGVRTEKLGATEYTLVTIAVDETGSVWGFEDDLRDMLITIAETLKDPVKCQRTDYILLRVIKFSARLPNGTEEIHGFKPMIEIDPQSDYGQFNPGGGTPLFDACYSSVGAMNAYGQKLIDDEFGVNAIAYVITDGDNTYSTATEKMIKEEMEKAVVGEIVESMVSVLIGINAAKYESKLREFQKNAGITQYIDAGDATKENLAKLSGFVSQSVSSQSQALGTGGPSQNISATI